MFYFIRPDGLPTPFESFDEFYDNMRVHLGRVTETGIELVEMNREDFHSLEVPEGHGILGLQTFAWFLHDQFIGYEI